MWTKNAYSFDMFLKASHLIGLGRSEKFPAVIAMPDDSTGDKFWNCMVPGRGQS